MAHKQPALEKHLRNSINTEYGDIRLQSTLTSVTEDKNFIYANYEDQNGSSHTIRSRFLVGADGKTGFVRKKYLEPKGVVMEKSEK